jgi:anionic cell wall polymer biosynthesis LytR-Cps2A-Psr (LCP) family protein
MKNKIIKTILIIFTSFIFLLTVIFASVYFELFKISKKINQSPNYLITTAYSAWKNNDFQNLKTFNFILLGLDKRDDLLEKTETTDTIIFGTFNFLKNKLSLISLPRDIWSYEIDAKINNKIIIHYYGKI